MRLRVPGMSGWPFIQISRMIRSLSSSRWALSSSSADVNTFMFSVRSKRLCLLAERSEVVSQSESESLESEDKSAGRARFLAGGRSRGWQSVRQEIWTTRAKRVRKRPKHTPQTKNKAALSGWSSAGESGRTQMMEGKVLFIRFFHERQKRKKDVASSIFFKPIWPSIFNYLARFAGLVFLQHSLHFVLIA